MSEQNDFLSNRITRAVAEMNKRLAEVDDEARQRVADTATMETDEYLAFGSLPSEMLVMGILDADSAQALHVIHQDFDGSSLGARVVFLQVMAEYLGMKIKAAR